MYLMKYHRNLAVFLNKLYAFESNIRNIFMNLNNNAMLFSETYINNNKPNTARKAGLFRTIYKVLFRGASILL